MSASSFPEQSSFSSAPAEILDSNTLSVLVYNIFACLTFSLSATQIYGVQERCWFAQIDFFHKYFPHWVNVLLLPSQFCRQHTQTRMALSRCTDKHSQFGTFPNRVPIELSRIALHIIVLPKDDRTDFVQEERLDLPYWTMMLASCVLVDVSKYLDILTSEFSFTMEHLPF